MSPPAPPSSLPSTAGPGQVRPRGPGLCPRPLPTLQQPGAPHAPAPSLGPGLGCRAWPCRHCPQLSTVQVLDHLSWPRIHAVPHAGVFDGSRVPGAHWPCAGSRVLGDCCWGSHKSPRVGSMWGPRVVIAQAGLAGAGAALIPAHGTASPCPCCPQHLLGFCLHPWLGPLRAGSPPPPEGLSAYTHALQQQ